MRFFWMMLFVVWVVVCMPLVVQGAPAGEGAVAQAGGGRFESARFLVEASTAGMGGLEYHARLCEAVLDTLAPDYPRVFAGPSKIRVRVCSSREDFERSSNMNAHTLLAVAFQDGRAMVLNDAALRAAGLAKREETVAHEMVHLLLGRAMRGRVRVPYWLHEGLAQCVSGYEPGAGDLTVAWAAVTGHLIPMTDLIGYFPYGDASAPLAYGQSESFTRFVAKDGLAFESPEALFRFILARPGDGATIVGQLGDASVVANLQARWEGTVQGPLAWLVALTGGGIGWVLVTLLFVAAYLLKRRRARRMAAEWDSWEGEADDDRGS